MEKYAWEAKIKDGCLEEYIRRHNALWPEMKETLTNAGIKDYTICNIGNEMFGYYECEKGIAYAAKYQAESAVVSLYSFRFILTVNCICDSIAYKR